MHFNIQGMIEKVHQLEALLVCENVDVVCLSEHWVIEDIDNFSIGEYKCISFFRRKNMTRGGVCILAKESLNMVPVEASCVSAERALELCCAKFLIEDKVVNIFCVYRSPAVNFELFLDHFARAMERLYVKGGSYLVCGDLNVDILNLKNVVKTRRQADSLLSFLLEFNLKPSILQPTRIDRDASTCIDNIYTDFENYSTTVVNTFLSDHSYQIIGLPLERPSTTNDLKVCRSFNYVCMSEFRYEIGSIDWLKVLGPHKDVNSQFSVFHNIILHVFETNFPLKNRQKKKEKDRYTMSMYLRNLSSLLREMSVISKRIDSPQYRARFKILKSYYKCQIRAEKKSRNDKRLSRANNVTAEAWKIVQESNGTDCRTISQILGKDNTLIGNVRDICDNFNKYFLGLCEGNKQVAGQRSGGTKTQSSFFLYPTDPVEVCEIIKHVCQKKSSGIDGIPGHVITKVADMLCSPLSDLINRSFVEGIYPESLKTSKVVPVFKRKGDRRCIDNYRPVSLQCHLGKVFEFSFNKRLAKYLEGQCLLFECQHGFRERHSTVSALNQAMDFIYSALNSKRYVLGLFFDLSRAFDSVSHDLLFKKLERVGIRGTPACWIKSYLSNRRQQVEISGVRSDEGYVTLGTPQGSCLSPTLFNIFIDDVSEVLAPLGCPVIYADDTTLLVDGESREEISHKANLACSCFAEWCRSNGLKANNTKTVAMQFYTKNSTINSSLLIKFDGKFVRNVSVTKFLGLRIDQKCIWYEHISCLTNRLGSCCFLLRNLRGTVSDAVLRNVYFGMFQSVMAYGVMFWGDAHEATRVFRVQKKAIRIMTGISALTSCKKHFLSLGIMTLPSIFIYSLIMYVKQNGSQRKCEDIHGHNTRSKENLLVPFSRLSVGQKSIAVLGSSCLNKLVSLDSGFKDIGPHRHFRLKLKKFLVSKCYYSLREFFEDR